MSQQVSPPTIGAVVVLAAGQGTRMRSATPKVLHRLGGRSMLGHVLAAAAPLGAPRTVVVVGSGRAAVAEHLAEVAPHAQTVVQERAAGLRARRGHRAGRPGRGARGGADPHRRRTAAAAGDADRPGRCAPRRRRRAHRAHRRGARPDGAGPHRARRQRRGPGHRRGEGRRPGDPGDHRDQRRRLRRQRGGRAPGADPGGRRATSRASSTSPTSSACSSATVSPWAGTGPPTWPTPSAATTSASSPSAGGRCNDRVLDGLMRAGVVGGRPDDHLGRRHRRGRPRRPCCSRAPSCWGPRRSAPVPWSGRTPRCWTARWARAPRSCARTASSAVIGPAATVGPFSYLRPNTRLARGAKVGAFVETKNVQVGEDSKVPHLSYVGDATIGEHSNIGAATVFVNYDGVAKHRHHGRRPRPDRLGHHARGAGHRRRRRVHRGRVGDHRGRPARGDGRRPGAPAECGRLGRTTASGDARSRGRSSGR